MLCGVRLAETRTSSAIRVDPRRLSLDALSAGDIHELVKAMCHLTEWAQSLLLRSLLAKWDWPRMKWLGWRTARIELRNRSICSERYGHRPSALGQTEDPVISSGLRYSPG